MSGKQLPMASKTPPALRPKPKRERLPSWFKTTLPSGEQQALFNKTKAAVKDNALHTVCQEARCPNIHDCWASGDATFMIAGQECTRGCRFCAVGTIKTPPPLEVNEPKQLADAVDSMNLRHVVITVVNRDDLPDSGAEHYKSCIDAVHERSPEITLELLCSDLAGDQKLTYWYGFFGPLLHSGRSKLWLYNFCWKREFRKQCLHSIGHFVRIVSPFKSSDDLDGNSLIYAIEFDKRLVHDAGCGHGAHEHAFPRL